MAVIPYMWSNRPTGLGANSSQGASSGEIAAPGAPPGLPDDALLSPATALIGSAGSGLSVSISDTGRQLAQAHAAVTTEVDRALAQVWQVSPQNEADSGDTPTQAQTLALVNNLGRLGNTPGRKTIVLGFPSAAAAQRFQETPIGQQILRLAQSVERFGALSAQSVAATTHLLTAMPTKSMATLSSNGKIISFETKMTTSGSTDAADEPATHNESTDT